MKIEIVKISDLKPSEYNPRVLTEKQGADIKNSLTRFGFVDPIVVNKNPERENIIIGGHQRVKVWELMGNDEVPVFYVYLPIEEEKELNVRLNKNTGEWDWDILANEFDMEKLEEWGFSEAEFNGGWGDKHEDFSQKNQEINADELGDECTLKLLFENEVYLNVLDRLSKLKKDNESNEQVFIRMLELYESSS